MRKPTQRYSKAAMLADIRRVHAEVGEVSRMIYAEYGGYLPETVINYFGTWSAAREQAGVPQAKPGHKGQRRRPAKLRVCLKCDARFKSTGPDNRICNRHKSGKYADGVRVTVAEGWEMVGE